MRNEFTAIVEQDGPWFVAYCAEVPGANGQARTQEECLANLREAIALILQHRRETLCVPYLRTPGRNP
jgi:predicted RNase H-like HicB family nuclease